VLTCGLCSSVFDLAFVYTWTHHGKPAVLHPNYEAELERLRQGRRAAEDIVAIGWLVEELRVSLFAQHLGTATKVSAQRIQRAIAAITP
jgi:hypothetical protein